MTETQNQKPELWISAEDDLAEVLRDAGFPNSLRYEVLNDSKVSEILEATEDYEVTPAEPFGKLVEELSRWFTVEVED